MKKQDNKIIAPDIDASLSYGQIFASNGWKAITIFMYVLCGFLTILIILLLIPIVLRQYDNEILITFIGGSITNLILWLATYLIHMNYAKGKKKATVWLEDAIVLEAYAKSVGQTLHVRNMIARTATAIEVSFEYDDKRCVRQSTYKDKPLYLAVYTKYADKKILIAYSPKYDEVMLIKPESAKRYRGNNK